MPQSHDIIVIGAGFAGLACARRAAERGLSVLVLDRQSEPGERIHTTGILVKEAWEEWVAPDPVGPQDKPGESLYAEPPVRGAGERRLLLHGDGHHAAHGPSGRRNPALGC